MKKKYLYPVLSLVVVTGLALWSFAATSIPNQRIAEILDSEATLLSPSMKQELNANIHELSLEYQIDPLLVMAIVTVESHFQPQARSYVGALGLMQVRPIVLREVEKDLGRKLNHSPHALLDPQTNLRVGIHYFGFLLKRFGGDIALALKAYNEGPTRVAHLYQKRAIPKSHYARKVLAYYDRYREGS